MSTDPNGIVGASAWIDRELAIRPLIREDGHGFGTDPIVVAYGAGVDSTAMLMGLRDRGIPIALILFADTGSEKPETYAYLPVIQAWLATNRMPPVTILKRNSPRAGDASLHGECLRKRVLPSLAYGGHSCSMKWKVDPQWAATRAHFGWDARARRWAHGPFITKLIGYDAGPRDTRRMAQASGKWPPGHRYRYPLQERGWTREDCEASSPKGSRCRLSRPASSVRHPRSRKWIGWRRCTPSWCRSQRRWSAGRTSAA